jgi:hypothetical protein
MRALALAGDRAGAIEQASIYEVLIEEDVELPPDRGVVAFAERLRAGWDPRDGEAEPWTGEAGGSSRAATSVDTATANRASGSDAGVAGVVPGSAPSTSGSRAHVWRRALLLAALALVLASAFWLLGAQPTRPAASRGAAPNGGAALGGEAGIAGPHSGIGAR